MIVNNGFKDKTYKKFKDLIINLKCFFKENKYFYSMTS